MILILIIYIKVIEIKQELLKMKSNLFHALKTVSNQVVRPQDIQMKKRLLTRHMTYQAIYEGKQVVIKSGRKCSLFRSGFG